MTCPFCNSQTLQVKVAKTEKEQDIVIFKCLNCQHMFTQQYAEDHEGWTQKRFWDKDDEPPQ